MPLEAIAEPVLGILWRVIVWIFAEVILHILIQGLGFILCRPFKKVDIEDNICSIVGLIVWVLIAIIAVSVIVNIP